MFELIESFRMYHVSKCLLLVLCLVVCLCVRMDGWARIHSFSIFQLYLFSSIPRPYTLWSIFAIHAHNLLVHFLLACVFLLFFFFSSVCLDTCKGYEKHSDDQIITEICTKYTKSRIQAKTYISSFGRPSLSLFNVFAAYTKETFFSSVLILVLFLFHGLG